MFKMTNARKAVLPEEDGIAFLHSEVTKEHTNTKKIAIHSNCAYNTSMTAHYASQVNGMINHLTAMIPEQATAKNMHLLRKIAEKSYLLADEVYSASDAEAWGNGYVVSDELIDSDERLFKSSMRDTDKMTKRRQNLLKPSRLNKERVELFIRDDNPEKEKILLSAEKGMPLLLRPGFLANGKGPLPPLRKLTSP